MIAIWTGLPGQQRRWRGLPPHLQLDVHASVHASLHTIVLKFINTGRATVAFNVRSGNAADTARGYTVEPAKQMEGAWDIPPSSSCVLSVYAPNGFVRYFKGRIGSGAANLDVDSDYNAGNRGSIQ